VSLIVRVKASTESTFSGVEFASVPCPTLLGGTVTVGKAANATATTATTAEITNVTVSFFFLANVPGMTLHCYTSSFFLVLVNLIQHQLSASPDRRIQTIRREPRSCVKEDLDAASL
jgi:hypothetical protein